MKNYKMFADEAKLFGISKSDKGKKTKDEFNTLGVFDMEWGNKKTPTKSKRTRCQGVTI